MNSESRNIVIMATRVRDLLIAHPFGSAQADAVVAKFVELHGRAEVLIDQQAAGEAAAHASTVRRAELRKELVQQPLRHVKAVVRAGARVEPALAQMIRVPAKTPNEQELRTLLHNLLTQMETHRALLLDHGLSEEALTQLSGGLEEYDRAVTEANAARRAHTGAVAELKTVSSALLRMVKQLDGMVLYRFREQPELQGAWESARNVAWPHPSAGEAPTAQGTVGPTK